MAKVLVLAPFAPAEGILTLRRSGLLREERFAIAGGSHTLAIPVEEGFTPNVHVQVDLVGQAPREETPAGASAKTPTRPAFASGSLDLPVPPASRTLDLAVTPRDKALAPGGETVLDLVLRDADGRPVANGEAAVVVVDEAVLALTGYRLPDPLDVFYARRGADVSDHRLRSYVLLARPDELAPPAGVADAVGAGAVMEMAASPAPAMAAPQMMRSKAMSAEDKAPEPIRARTDFSALALFAASVPTDAEGRARVPVKLPDSLTRYRVMAVAVEGARRFGSGEATLVARLPLMVRPSAPRFLNFGDRFELPVVVQNQTDAEMTVDVAVRARNAALTAGRRTPPRGGRERPRGGALPDGRGARGTGADPGGRRVRRQRADAAEVELPVWTPATTEAFATYGQIDEGSVVQPVKAPAGVVPEFGGLEVTTSSTALQALTDAVLYLVAYPFECAEQLSSRVLAVAALRDVLTAFQAEGLPKPDEIEAAVKRDIDRLRALQNDDGSFGFWRRGDESWPYVSIHVAHALARAKAKGFPVPDDTLERSRRYLREIDRHIPSEYGTDVRRTLQAYALSVRALMGDGDPARARALVREAGVEGLSFEALGWVLPVLSKDAGSVGRGRRPSAAASPTTSRRPRAPPTSPSPTATARTCCSTPTGAPTRSCSRPSSPTSRRATSSPSSWRACSPTARPGAGRTRRRTSSSSSPSTATSGPTRRRRPTSWPAPGSASATRAPTSSGAARPSGATSRSRCPTSGKGRARATSCSPRRARAGSTTGSACATRRTASSSSRSTAGSPSSAPTRVSTTRRTSAGPTTAPGTSAPAPASACGSRWSRPSRRYHVALVDPLPAGLEPMNPALAVTGTVPGDGGSDVTPIGAPGLGGPRSPGALVVVVAAVVRAPEPARRPRGGLLLAAVGGRPHLPLRRASHHPRHVRRPAPEGRGDVRPRDLRPRRDRPRHRRIGRTRSARLSPAVLQGGPS